MATGSGIHLINLHQHKDRGNFADLVDLILMTADERGEYKEIPILAAEDDTVTPEQGELIATTCCAICKRYPHLATITSAREFARNACRLAAVNGVTPTQYADLAKMC